MTKAIWEGTLLAESDACVIVEGNSYPPKRSRKNICVPVQRRRYVRGKESHTTTTSRCMAKRIPTPPGITLNQKKRRKKSKAELHSGKA